MFKSILDPCLNGSTFCMIDQWVQNLVFKKFILRLRSGLILFDIIRWRHIYAFLEAGLRLCVSNSYPCAVFFFKIPIRFLSFYKRLHHTNYIWKIATLLFKYFLFVLILVASSNRVGKSNCCSNYMSFCHCLSCLPKYWLWCPVLTPQMALTGTSSPAECSVNMSVAQSPNAPPGEEGGDARREYSLRAVEDDKRAGEMRTKRSPSSRDGLK